MADFTASLTDESIHPELEQALRGRGAFRSFKGKAFGLNLEDQWYAYRDARYRALAIEWCETNGIEWHEKETGDESKP